MDQAIIDKYEARVIRRDGEECWGWGGNFHSHGYGQISFRYKKLLAHRVSYEIRHGAVPTGLDVMHSCHNPSCSNPAHLELGNRKANMQTSFVAGRLQRKIPLSEMPLIFEMHAAGWKYRELAKLYDCTAQAVSHMIKVHPELSKCHG